MLMLNMTECVWQAHDGQNGDRTMLMLNLP